MNASDIRLALSCGKPGCACKPERGVLTHCPSHTNVNTPALTVRDGDSAVLLTCHTGCPRESIITALKARDLWPQGQGGEREWRDPDTIYRFVDAEGQLVGEKGRVDYLDRGTGEMKKRFLWRLPGSPKWGGLNGAVMPLYNLPDVIRRPGQTVFFVEGEKAAQSLTVRGLVAVCGYAGAEQKMWDEPSLALLEGRELVLWPDNDATGFGLMGRLLWRFPDAHIIRPDLPEKADAHDYFEMGGTVEALARMARVSVTREAMPTNVIPITRATGVRPFVAS